MSDLSVISLLTQMVSIETVNPPGENYSDFQRMIRRKLTDAKVRTKLYEFNRGKPNLVAYVGRGRPHLLLSTHIDVVAPGTGWKTNPFLLEKHGGRLFGRGAVDAKGSLAAMLSATLTYADLANEMNGTLIFAATVEEETGGFPGLGALAARRILVPDFGIIGEPTDLDIAICQKGVCWYEITVEGKAAHAATPEFGINAIEETSKLVLKLQSFKPRALHKILGRPTRNVGMISGGAAPNTVPDQCTIKVDRRLIPGETPADARKEVEKELMHLKNATPELKYRIHEMLNATPFELSQNLPFIKQVTKASKDVTRRKPALTGICGFTDARHLRPSPRRTIVIMGPGNISQAHVANEHMREHQLLQATEIYGRIIEEVLIRGNY